MAVLLFANCSKNNRDNQPPVINLSSPSNHQTFAVGDKVPITATISDDDELHEVHLYVKNKATGIDILHVEEHPDTKTFNLSKTFAGQSGVTYKIQIEANDHSSNQAEVEIEISFN